MEIHSGSRTLEAPRGIRYAPARGLFGMMMMYTNGRYRRAYASVASVLVCLSVVCAVMYCG